LDSTLGLKEEEAAVPGAVSVAVDSVVATLEELLRASGVAELEFRGNGIDPAVVAGVNNCINSMARLASAIFVETPETIQAGVAIDSADASAAALAAIQAASTVTGNIGQCTAPGPRRARLNQLVVDNYVELVSAVSSASGATQSFGEIFRLLVSGGQQFRAQSQISSKARISSTTSPSSSGSTSAVLSTASTLEEVDGVDGSVRYSAMHTFEVTLDVQKVGTFILDPYADGFPAPLSQHIAVDYRRIPETQRIIVRVVLFVLAIWFMMGNVGYNPSYFFWVSVPVVIGCLIALNIREVKDASGLLDDDFRRTTVIVIFCLLVVAFIYEALRRTLFSTKTPSFHDTRLKAFEKYVDRMLNGNPIAPLYDQQHPLMGLGIDDTFQEKFQPLQTALGNLSDAKKELKAAKKEEKKESKVSRLH